MASVEWEKGPAAPDWLKGDDDSRSDGGSLKSLDLQNSEVFSEISNDIEVGSTASGDIMSRGGSDRTKRKKKKKKSARRDRDNRSPNNLTRGAADLYGNAGDYPLEVLRYKAQRGCCLTFFGVLHLTTFLAAVCSVVTQTIDMVRPPHVDETAWNYSQALVLRLYGVVFGLCVCFIEMSEFECCGKCHKCFDMCVRWFGNLQESVQEQPIVRIWFLRGLGYIFVGLYSAESSLSYIDDNGHLVASVGEKDSTLRETIRASGNFLQVVGCLYLLMQLTCCRRIKSGLVTELRQVRAYLNDHHKETRDSEALPLRV